MHKDETAEMTTEIREKGLTYLLADMPTVVFRMINQRSSKSCSTVSSSTKAKLPFYSWRYCNIPTVLV